MNRRWFVAILLATFLGLFLRTWNLTGHGFSHYDEAHYMMEVKFWKDVVYHRADLLDALRAGRLNAAFIEQTIDGLPPNFTPKPLHGFFMAAFSLATGIDAEWSGCLWSALVGTLTIVMVGWWTSRRFGAVAGMLAALLIAVARVHVMYSRSQLAEADAIFFCTLAVFWHVDVADPPSRSSQSDAGGRNRSTAWPCLGIGVLYGIAIGVNYRCALLLPLVWLWDAAVLRDRAALVRMAYMLAGIGCVVGMMELPYQVYLLRGGTLPPGMHTYLGGFWARLFQDIPTAERAAGHTLGPHLRLFADYRYLQPLIWIFVFGSLGVFIRRREPAIRLVALIAVLPPLMFSLTTRGDGPRAVMTSIPFMMVLIAVGLAELMRAWAPRPDLGPSPGGRDVRRMGHRAVMTVTVLLIALWAFRSSEELMTQSAWPEAGRWLRQNVREPIHTTFPLAVRCYLRKNPALLPASGDTSTLSPGIWVVDRLNAEYAYPFPVVRRLRALQKPEIVFRGSVYPSSGLFLDWGVFKKGRDWEMELTREDMGNIEIYRVTEVP